MEGCYECSAFEQCSSCDIGYYLVSASCTACASIHENCTDCSTDPLDSNLLKCSVCSIGSHINENGDQCIECSTTFVGCSECQNDGSKCDYCD